MIQLATSFANAAVNGILAGLPIALLVWIVLRLVPRRALNAATRYAIWWACLAVVAALPVVSLLPRAPAPVPISAPEPMAIDPRPAAEPIAVTLSEPAAITSAAPRAGIQFPIEIPAGRWTLAFSALWAGATLALLLRLAMSYALLKRRKLEASDATPQLDDRASSWRSMLALRRRPRVLISFDVRTPIAAGLRQPVILIPARLIDHLSETELDQIGLHESAHFARFDDWALLVQRVIEAVLFFHPAVRWIVREIDLEREIACDDLVVRATGNARPYAACLTRVVELSDGVRGSLVAAAAVTDEGSHLTRRVEALLDRRRNSATRVLFAKLGIAVAALAAIGIAAAQFPAVVAFAQDQPPPPPPPPPAVAPEPPPGVAPEPPAPPAPPRKRLAAYAPAPPAPAPPAPQPAPPEPPQQQPPPPPPVPPPSSGVFIHGPNTDWTWRDGSMSRELRIRGRVEFTDDESDVKSLAAGGWFSIEDSRGFSSRRYQIAADNSGQLTRHYMVDGRDHPIDDEARAWLRALLPDILRDTGIDAHERVERILKRGGPDAVLAEIAKIHGGYARRRYIQELVSQARLKDDQYQTVLRYVREIQSDNDKASMLITLAPYILKDGLRDHAFAAVSTIRSSNDKRRVLLEFVNRDASRATAAAAARTAEEIPSDNDKAAVLMALVSSLRGNDDVRRPFFRTASTIRSSNDRSRVLMGAINAAGEQRESLADALRATAGVMSDNDRARILIHAAGFWKDDESVRREYFAVAREIRSTNDRSRALLAVLDRRGLSEATLLDCISSAEGIMSDNDKARVLMAVIPQAANKPAVRERLRVAAHSVRSDSDYRRVMNALDRV